MLFQDYFKYFDIWDAVESGLYYIIVGYYFLIFAYFLIIRFRTSKKMYWLYFSFLFLFLAAGRFFFIVYYFYAPELEGAMSNFALVELLMLYYRFATFSTWLGIACLMGVFGILIFPPITEIKEKLSGDNLKSKIKKFTRKKYNRIILKILLIFIPIIVGILAFCLPDSLFMDPDLNDQYLGGTYPLITIFGYPVGRAVLNFILLPLMVIFIPIMFIYLALKTFGVLRKSYALNALGFFIYFLGRILQGVLDTFGFYHVNAILPPLLILLSLLIIVIANNYEQLR
ncbi:MAG: hypothetical protein ACFE85_01390 [Candidatus Hodarchaeota archaeon]